MVICENMEFITRQISQRALPIFHAEKKYDIPSRDVSLFRYCAYLKNPQRNNYSVSDMDKQFKNYG